MLHRFRNRRRHSGPPRRCRLRFQGYDILIFMIGQDDIEKLVSKLENRVRSLNEGSCMDAVNLLSMVPCHLKCRVQANQRAG
ncbi:probable pre-mRNA-splicing factor ATP-dependent RNA helicase DEAH4 isoform X2 [Durio zibethinus]|uniref:Probable pre-mRNA-splicing factor ATP-dependent RNA helicase DEAH4 isoform X2 n=1 Tax=Durio zibethinus TaxID=66656 RepID=A0A6P6BGQ4_DURZI|nr:probable pre-mRNA-splicing factor ATP-dependent RNA helicase DEAH4 isoform X2 [Durio zibethinus]